MKAVLISIQPKWCELIASGKKTVEVRKTKPKLETPFKVYIYATEPRSKRDVGLCLDDGKVVLIYRWYYDYAKRHKMPILSGKVIGEFVCDNIAKGTSQLGSCLSLKQIREHANGKDVYGWHISDLVIYDKPKELSEFKQCHKCEYYANCFEHELSCDGIYKLKSPPQSWFYVEEVRQ